MIATDSASLSNKYIILHIVRKKLWGAKVPDTGTDSNSTEEERPGSINGRVQKLTIGGQ
jgi:hypothetical protein